MNKEKHSEPADKDPGLTVEPFAEPSAEPSAAFSDAITGDVSLDEATLGEGDSAAGHWAIKEAELIAEHDSWRDKAYRAAADSENTRRRAERDVSQARRYGAERLAQALLPAIDNLTRALSAVGEEAGAGASNDFQNLHTALVMTAKELNKALEQNGIQRLNPLGEPFDPQQHQAMLQVASDELPEGRVAQVLSEGFILHDRLLKAAYVAVSTGPGPDQSTEVSEAAETAEMAGSSSAVEPPSAEPH